MTDVDDEHDLGDAADEAYWIAIENSPEFIASIARARAPIAAGRSIPSEELLRKLDAIGRAGQGGSAH